MIPSSTWFPSGWAERVEWFNTFATAFAVIGPALGFNNATVQQVNDDNAMMQFLGDNVPLANNYQDAVRALRRTVTEGDVNGTTPDFPSIGTIQPGTPVAQGIFERLDNLVKRIRLAPNYTDEEGEQLGIIPKKTQSISPDNAQPTLSANTDPGNIVFVKFKKLGFKGVQISIAIDKGNWQDQGRFTVSPATLTIPQHNDDAPRAVAIRARYLVGDNPVGEWSDVVYITTTP